MQRPVTTLHEEAKLEQRRRRATGKSRRGGLNTESQTHRRRTLTLRVDLLVDHTHSVIQEDTLIEVPHWSDEGLALQARASGPWPHEKESVLQVKLVLLARCKSKLLWTECNAQR